MVFNSQSNERDYWGRVSEARGLLFRGNSLERLKKIGYTNTEIKSAVTLNQKYFLNKLRENGVFVLSC